MAEPSPEQIAKARAIAKAVEAFAAAQTWIEKKLIVEAQRDLLLTDGADYIFAREIEQSRGDANATQLLKEHREVLARCRSEGIEKAFAGYLLPLELQTLLVESERFTLPSEMPRKIEVYRAVLRLVNRDTDPQLWGLVQYLLANCLLENPLDDRAENLEQAIVHYGQALTVHTREAFPEQWAMTQHHLAYAYSERIRGDRTENLEQAIRYWKQALRVYTRQSFPKQWAAMHYNLANAYFARMEGKRAQNLEQAIHYWKQALLVYTPQAFPEDWAATQYNLAIAYGDRMHGERAQNLEQAIQHGEQALTVRTREAFPEDWAATQHSLADLYSDRILGEQAENLERAIQLCQQALTVRTREVFPEDWAATQINLAYAYRNRILGPRAENLELAIFHCEQALQVYTLQAHPEQWAAAQQSLASAYSLRIRGEQAENLEQAIHLCEEALQVYTSQAFPEDWAAIQNNLAVAYCNRILGERAENLEQAIQLCQQAFQVYTRRAFPEQWAMTQHNLAYAYSDRIRGKRAENLEQAIQHYEQALRVYTSQAFPKDWAATQHGLAYVYRDRIRGSRAENLERAAQYCEQALTVRTREALPEQWAATQHNLAYIYRNRIREGRAENLEWAIFHCEQALQVYTLDAFPKDWAATQHSLAYVYNIRIRGERAENLEWAITHYEQALTVRTRESFPEDWAATQNNLAIAYSDRIRRERPENLEQAIRLYEETLQVYTPQAFPEQWAMTQHNLAYAYSDRIRGKRDENLEQAIHHCKQALQVYTPQAFPEQWAAGQHNLANSFLFRMHGEPAENLEQAIQHYEQALLVSTPTAYPQNSRDTAYSLGRLYYETRLFAEARRVLITAHLAVQAMRSEVQRSAAKRALAEENANLYARLVACCLREGDEAAAFEYAVAGKGRTFVDLLVTARLDLSALGATNPALADDLHTARALRQEIDNLQIALTTASGRSISGLSHDTGVEAPDQASLLSDALRTQLRALQAQEKSHWEDMAYRHPALTATQIAPTLTVEQARALAASLEATLVEYYQHAEGWCAFVVTPNTLHYIPLPLLDELLLAHMANWVKHVESKTNQGFNRLSYLQLSEWHSAIIAPLQTYLPLGQPVVLAPFGQLHVLPLTAARDPRSGRYLAEDYLLAFTPSLAALRIVRDQVHGKDEHVASRRLLNVAYPGVPENKEYYLSNVLLEAQAIAGYFERVTPLYEDVATPDAVIKYSRDQDVIHFGCHGQFDAEQPEQSGLMLSGGWLTVQRIITELQLDQVRLTTLSACRSGRAKVQSGDEYVGLLQAMLTSRVQAVVASLWKVDDEPTYALFAAFYAGLTAGYTPASALREAARVVREDPRHPGWKHPYFWAAFQVSGLAHSAEEST